MEPAQEIELKLRLVEAGDYQLLVNDPLWSSQFRTEQVRVNRYSTTYYDTPDHRLYQNGFSYRIRKTNDDCVATVKDQGSQRGGLFVRGEWNQRVDSEAATVEPFRQSEVGPVLAEIVGQQALQPLFSTDFERTAIDLRNTAGSLIELAADQGMIRAEGGQAPIGEVELELKEGTPAELLQVGAVLAAAYRLQVEERSKYQRGLELLGLDSQTVSPPAPIDRRDSVAAALQTQGIYFVQEIFSAMAACQADPADPETIHQMRVKIRQLRSWLSFFKPVIQPEPYQAMTAVLTELADRLGYIREIDVLQQGWQQIVQANSDLLRGDGPLQQRLKVEREREQALVQGQMAAGVGTAGLLQVWGCLLQGCWEPEGPAELPLAPFMERRLRRWRQRLEKGMERTDFRDLPAVHALRIQAKKLRYALQTLEPVLGKKQRQRLPGIKGLQERLGIICDTQRNIAILQDLSSDRKNTALNYESGLYTGYLLCQAVDLTAAASQGFPELT